MYTISESQKGCRIKVNFINDLSCFKVLLSSEQFCKRYLYRHYNLEDEERPSGILGTWSNNDIWACYWLDSDPYDYDDPEFWVFSDPPRRWKCGIVHLADYDLKMHKDLKYKDFLRAVYILCRIQKAAYELDLDCCEYRVMIKGVVTSYSA